MSGSCLIHALQSSSAEEAAQTLGSQRKQQSKAQEQRELTYRSRRLHGGLVTVNINTLRNMTEDVSLHNDFKQ